MSEEKKNPPEGQGMKMSPEERMINYARLQNIIRKMNEREELEAELGEDDVRD